MITPLATQQTFTHCLCVVQTRKRKPQCHQRMHPSALVVTRWTNLQPEPTRTKMMKSTGWISIVFHWMREGEGDCAKRIDTRLSLRDQGREVQVTEEALVGVRGEGAGRYRSIFTHYRCDNTRTHHLSPLPNLHISSCNLPTSPIGWIDNWIDTPEYSILHDSASL